MGILGDYICPDCGYRTAVRSELAKDVDIKAYMESREAEGHPSVTFSLRASCSNTPALNVAQQLGLKMTKPR